jgi:hypothetical protein
VQGCRCCTTAAVRYGLSCRHAGKLSTAGPPCSQGGLQFCLGPDGLQSSWPIYKRSFFYLRAKHIFLFLYIKARRKVRTTLGHVNTLHIFRTILLQRPRTHVRNHSGLLQSCSKHQEVSRRGTEGPFRQFFFFTELKANCTDNVSMSPKY